jgi:hypothetical protein
MDGADLKDLITKDKGGKGKFEKVIYMDKNEVKQLNSKKTQMNKERREQADGIRHKASPEPESRFLQMIN